MSVPSPLAVRNPDFTVGPYTFVDSRYVPAGDYAIWKRLIGEAFATKLPPEIHCKATGANDTTMSIVQGMGAQAVTAYLAEIDPSRVTEQEMLGEIFPVRCVVYEDGQAVGAFEWYAIHIVGYDMAASPPEIHVRGMPFPAFHEMGLSLSDQMKLTADVVEVYLASKGVAVGPYVTRPTEVWTYTFVNAQRDSAGDQECAAWNAEIDARAASPGSLVSVALTVETSGREKRVITWGP